MVQVGIQSYKMIFPEKNGFVIDQPAKDISFNGNMNIVIKKSNKASTSLILHFKFLTTIFFSVNKFHEIYRAVSYKGEFQWVGLES
jgi:hypothetical protein